MKITGFRFCILLFLSSLGTACHTPRESVKAKALSENDRLNLEYLFYNGTKEKILGNGEVAAGLFIQCLNIDPNNDASMYEIAQIYAMHGNNREALPFIKNAARLKSGNIWYQQFYAEVLVKNNMHSEAAGVYEALLKKYPDNPEFYYDLASALTSAGRISEAIAVYDKLESYAGISQEVVLQKERLYLRLGKVDKAAAEIQKLIETSPGEVRYYGMLAELYQANNMNEKALETFQKAREKDPENPYVHLSLADYYRASGEKEKSFSELKEAFSSTRLEVETKINILASYFVLVGKYPELKNQSSELVQILIRIHPREAKGYAIYGDFLYKDKKYEEARKQYRQSLQLDKNNFLVWQQLLLIESALMDFSAMYSESEEAIALFPSQPLAFFFNGVAKMQEKKYEEAVLVLNAGLKLVVDNNALLAQFYASLGDAYFKLKKMKESDDAFDKSLVLDPKNTYVLNNYAYYLSLRNDSLEKAERMSLLSNQIETTNTSFQDTYGWILYKMGKYSGAKTWLEKALANEGQKSAVILEHYGDLLYKTGEGEKAIDYWMKAKQAGPASEFLDRKILEKKLIE